MTWELFLKSEEQKPYYQQLIEKIRQVRTSEVVFPKEEDVFACFTLTPLNKVKAVILGQDPYHDFNQAHGLSFSVLNDKYPKSLQNIFKELTDDLDIDYPKTGNLSKWAKEGVLLLNTVLTVKAHDANSHQGIGWEIFTKHVIELLNQQDQPIVYILWGKQAEGYKSLLHNSKHLIITSPHPSPLSSYRGFFGSKPFSRTNAFLLEHQVKPIDWDLNN